MIEQLQDQHLKLKRIYVKSALPEELAPLRALANNLWWSWQKEGIELFKNIAGAEVWESEEIRYNPLALLDSISYEKAQALVADKDFMKSLKALDKKFKAYLTAKPKNDTPKIAYFCMEYGLHISCRLYSGGLGVLAGDFMKEASDMNVNMRGVGLLYRYGYFQQSLSINGDQINNYPSQKFTKLPLIPLRNEQGEWIKISIDYPGRKIYAKVWKLMVGRIVIYLLDTDIDENSWEDRGLTHNLYGGNNEHRLKQEILLGIGGMRALEAAGEQYEVYHLNEGHAAFQGMERLRMLMKEQGLSFEEAKAVVRSSALFTTHTPVPAGHDYFPEGLLRTYFWEYIHDMGIAWEDFIALGRVHPENGNELFSMSYLASRLSQEVNGVSELHGTVSQKMFSSIYPGYNWEEVHVGYVTNSVHYPTWIANEWHEILSKDNNEKFLANQSNKEAWKAVRKLSDGQITDVRNQLKAKLLAHVRKVVQRDMTKRGDSPRHIFEVLNNINDNALIFGFARRFATYKRAHLLFTNLERLAAIVNDPVRPVMFVFSGKAHPADQGGQALIREIIQISKRPEFLGKVIFLENYNMESAKLLVQGVDVWLNTPTRPKEASGTSGMKAAMNGVTNFSVLDGWWAEGYRPDAGWALPLERTYDNQDLQNDLDAETIYNTLETDIIPTYFDRNEQGISPRWLSYVRNIMLEVAPTFTMKRMMDDYLDRYYRKLQRTSKKMSANQNEAAVDLTTWKAEMQEHWNQIYVVDMQVIDTENQSLQLGQHFSPIIKLDLNGAQPEEIGLEVVFFQRVTEQDLEIRLSQELDLKSMEGSIATYSADLPMSIAGVYEYGFRMYPKHDHLAHRQDFNLVRWL
ncbi:MAG: alpha-glucan family phosphorylase, partial [Bacteroidota bacterium]